MKKFFSLLTLSGICCFIFYFLLTFSVIVRPMGYGILIALMVCGAAGLLVFYEALYAFYGACRKWLAERRRLKKLERATARLPLQCRPAKTSLSKSKKAVSRC